MASDAGFGVTANGPDTDPPMPDHALPSHALTRRSPKEPSIGASESTAGAPASAAMLGASRLGPEPSAPPTGVQLDPLSFTTRTLSVPPAASAWLKATYGTPATSAIEA